jgi:hypothetical protein
MANPETLIRKAYSAFNSRDIDSALTLMTENVRWPKASEGGHVAGKAEVRAYWTRQWQAFDPIVEPIELMDREGGKIEVKVHQVVKSLSGEVLSDSEVRHIYTISDGLIEGMDLKEDEANTTSGPSQAFAKH